MTARPFPTAQFSAAPTATRTRPFPLLPAPRQFTPAATIHELTWWLPLVLFVAGWITLLFRNSNVAFEFGMVCATVVACRAIYVQLFSCKDFRFTWIIACNLLLGYGIGSFNTAVQLLKNHETVADHFFRPQYEFSTAFSLVLWSSASLLLVGGVLEKPMRPDPSKLVRSDLSYLGLSLLLYFAALATHQIGYMGASVSDEGHVTAFGSIAGMVSPIMPAITVLLRNQSKLLRNNLIFWGLLLVEIVSLLPSGRRMIIYSVLCTIFAFSLMNIAWQSALWKKALVIVLCASGFYSANLFFYAMRHIAVQSGTARRVGTPSVGLTELVSGATRFIREGRDDSFDQDLATNLRDRTFVLKYFSDMVAQSWTHTPLHGKLVLFGVEMATPSSIYSLFGSKDGVIALGMEEAVANPAFGLKAQDEANSYLTGGLSDFGIVGVFVYPVLLGLLINFAVRVGLSNASELMKCVVTMMFIFALFQTEFGFATIFVFARNTFILALGWIPVRVVMRFFMKPDTVAAPPVPTTNLQFAGATLVRYEAPKVP